MDNAIIRCGGCRQDLPETAFALDKARLTGRRYRCRACSAAEFKRWQQTDGYHTRLAKGRAVRKQLKDTDPKRRWAQMVLAAARTRSRRKGMPCALTLDWLLDAAPDRCPVLGTTLSYTNATSLANSAALDRIDNTRGYEPDNCWVISMKANRIKSDATLAEIEAVAQALRVMMDKRTSNAVQAEKDEPYAI
jgi:predicted amidohydrolase YtcJ